MIIAMVVLLALQISTNHRIDSIAETLHETGTNQAGIRQIANGNTVTIQSDSALPDAPRTVEQVAEFLGVTPDTVRDSYIRCCLSLKLIKTINLQNSANPKF